VLEVNFGGNFSERVVVGRIDHRLKDGMEERVRRICGNFGVNGDVKQGNIEGGKTE
jgi:hypothetical protein